MRKFCYELESGAHRTEVQKYRALVEKLAKWHTDSYKKYSDLLKTEVSMTAMSAELANAKEPLDLTGDLSYNYGAKLSYFNAAEALLKLILSCFSYGPSKEFFREHGFNDTLFGKVPDLKKDCDTSWLKVPYNSYQMTEVVAKVLRDSGDTISFDLIALLTERNIRNDITHASETSVCLSAMRCYNSIRAMLMFFDEKYEEELLEFNFSTPFSFDSFLMPPCDFNFENYTTVLIAGSVHDIRKDHRAVIANLPWDMVIDFDGYSDCGGLLSAVEHNRIAKSVLNSESANRIVLNRGETEWYCCGQYQQYDFIPRAGGSSFEIPAYNSFITKPLNEKGGRDKYKEADLRGILRLAFKAALKTERPLNIVAITDDYSIIKQIITAFHNEDVHEYFLSWIGITANSEGPQYILDSDEAEECFAYFCCPSKQFFQEFAEHQTMFSARSSTSTSFTLMTKDGLVPISENDRRNLSTCFEPLYEGCELIDPELQEETRNNFYNGNCNASWYVISNQYAIQIKRQDEYKRICDKITSLLGVLQPKAQKRLLFIEHRPGIGGTTFARQLAWELHNNYAVLNVHKYEANRVVRLVEYLYDNVLNKSPIVLLADDTLPSIRDLCDDVMRIERRCILIVSCRHTNNILGKYREAEQEAIQSLTDTAVVQLRSKYQSVSKLPPATLRVRDNQFNDIIKRDMHTPFIIGLYYLEEEYNVKAYIDKVFSECGEIRYLKMLACLALLDGYNYKNVPVSFVRGYLDLKPREEVLRIPSIASLITKDMGQIDTYRFKHNLLSRKYLDEYCQRYCEGSMPDMIYSLTESIIKAVAAMHYQNKLTEGHLDMLISVIIQNRNDYDTDSEELNLSTLLKEVARPEKQRDVLELLYNQFVLIANNIVDDDKDSDRSMLNHLIRRLVSHACAHLGRMYSRGAHNYKLAREWIEKGIDYVPDEDPDIFHMAGTIIMDELKSNWDKDREMLDVGTIEKRQLIEQLPEYENEIGRAEAYFEKACDYGSPDYGYPSMLALFYQYLKYVFEVQTIKNERDIDTNLSSYQRNMIARFLNILDIAKSYEDLDEKALSRITYYEASFYSKIMFANSGNEVQYYQNRYDMCKDGSILEWRVALRGLIQARLYAAEDHNNGRVNYRAVKNPKTLMEQIEQLLNYPMEEEYSYFDYMQKSKLYHHWIQLAKVTEKALKDVKSLLINWLSLEERRRKNINPEPFYYLRTVCYLMALEGYSREIPEAQNYDRKIQDHDRYNQFGSLFSNRYVLRDVIVEGRGMGQLVDVTYLSSQEIIDYLISIKKRPIQIEGHIRGALNPSVLLADAYKPIEWNTNIEFHVDIGKRSVNSLTDRQISHAVQYYGGFSILHPLALSDFIRDKDAEEYLDWDELACTESTNPSLHTKAGAKKETRHKAVNPAITRQEPEFTTSHGARSTDKISAHLTPSAAQEPGTPDLRKKSIPATLKCRKGKNAEGTFFFSGSEYKIRVVAINGKKDEKAVQTAIDTGKSVTVSITQNKQEDGFYVGKLS